MRLPDLRDQFVCLTGKSKERDFLASKEDLAILRPRPARNQSSKSFRQKNSIQTDFDL